MGRGHTPNGPARLSLLPGLNRRRPTSPNLSDGLAAVETRLGCVEAGSVGVKRLSRNNSHSKVELKDSATAVSRAGPVHPMDWVDAGGAACGGEDLPGHSPP